MTTAGRAGAVAVVRELLRNPPTQGVNAFGEPMVHMTVASYESCLDTLARAATETPLTDDELRKP